MSVSLFNKVAGLQPAILLIRDFCSSIFLWILQNFLRTSFFIEYLRTAVSKYSIKKFWGMWCTKSSLFWQFSYLPVHYNTWYINEIKFSISIKSLHNFLFLFLYKHIVRKNNKSFKTISLFAFPTIFIEYICVVRQLNKFNCLWEIHMHCMNFF